MQQKHVLILALTFVCACTHDTEAPSDDMNTIDMTNDVTNDANQDASPQDMEDLVDMPTPEIFKNPSYHNFCTLEIDENGDGVVDKRTVNEFDDEGRLLKSTLTDNTKTENKSIVLVEATYNAQGLLDTVKHAGLVEKYNYSSAGLLTACSGNKTRQFTYDTQGRLISWEEEGDHLKYDYTSDYIIERNVSKEGMTISETRYLFGLEQKIVRISQKTSFQPSPQTKVGYIYNKADQPTLKLEENSTVKYKYRDGVLAGRTVFNTDLTREFLRELWYFDDEWRVEALEYKDATSQKQITHLTHEENSVLIYGKGNHNTTVIHKTVYDDEGNILDIWINTDLAKEGLEEHHKYDYTCLKGKKKPIWTKKPPWFEYRGLKGPIASCGESPTEYYAPRHDRMARDILEQAPRKPSP